MYRRLLLGAGHPGQLRVSRRTESRSGDRNSGNLPRPRPVGRDGALMPRLVSHPDEEKVVSKRFGMGAANIDRYVEVGGYASARKCLAQGPEWIIEEMKSSSLPGARGLGFPTGLKWSLFPKRPESQKYVRAKGHERAPAP